jgi:hypothetical protein
MAHPRRRRQAPLLWDGTRHPKGVYTAGSWIRLSIQAPEPSEQSMGFVNTRVPWRNRIDRDGKAKYTDGLNPTSVPNMCFFPSPTPFVHEWTLAKMQYTASHTAPDEPKTQSTYIYTFLVLYRCLCTCSLFWCSVKILMFGNIYCLIPAHRPLYEMFIEQ